MAVQFTVDAGATLPTSLVAYWKLGESSGNTRVDSFDSHNLSEGAASAVGSATGIQGNAADFSGSATSLLFETDTSGLSGSDRDFTIAFWVYLDAKTSLRGLVTKGDWNAGTGREYNVEYNINVDRFRFRVRNTGDTANTTVDANNLGSPATATWYFIEAYHDSVNNLIGIRVNNGTVDTTATSSGVNNSTEPFVLGAYTYNTSGNGSQRLDGRLDEVGFWDKILSSQERSDLYNGGTGNTVSNVNTQTITSNTTILTGQFSQTITADSIIVSQVSQTITADTSIIGTVSQTINADSTILSLQASQTITSDSEIFGVSYLQTITANSTVIVATAQTITSDTTIKQVGIIQAIGANTTIFIQPSQTIQSNTIITINEAELKLFKESDLLTEIGISGSPLDFGIVEAGDIVLHPDNPFVLFNDKGGALSSVDAKVITVNVVQLDIIDELVGTSTGAASQSFTVAFPPAIDDSELLIVKVNNIGWERVTTFAGQQPTSQVYTFNASTGTVTFGDGLQGMIPTSGYTIKVAYTPDTLAYGKEPIEQLWISIKSNGVISNPIVVDLEEVTPDSTTQVTTLRKPLVSVEGVFLLADPNKLGTDYFAGGTFDSNTGVVTLGTALPDTEPVWVAYTYTIGDDLEGTFTSIGKTTTHTFDNGIPSNNGKKISFRISPPAVASPSSPGSIRFKVRFAYQE